MLRRQARLKRDFIYKRSVESKQLERQEKRKLLKAAIAGGKKIPRELQKDALELNEELDWEDAGGEGVDTAEDDEYANAGREDPNVMVTTSRSPSSKLKEFAKDIRFLIPNAAKINRGAYQMKELVDACLSHQVSDLIMVNETRGVPDSLTVSHLPFGPTAKFTLYNVHTRDNAHDPDNVGAKVPMAYPHHVFHGLNSKLGLRVRNILKYLFPVPKEDTKRVISWYEENDVIRVRNYTYKYENKQLKVENYGCRFDLKIYKIWRGPLNEEPTADVEWVMRPYMNTAYKRLYLSTEEVEKKESDAEEQD